LAILGVQLSDLLLISALIRQIERVGATSPAIQMFVHEPAVAVLLADAVLVSQVFGSSRQSSLSGITINFSSDWFTVLAKTNGNNA
jgi:hypothetical protein